MSVDCTGCKKELPARVAFICVKPMGDEYIYSFYFCAACDVYSKEIFVDRFFGPHAISVVGPIAKSEGDADVRAIRGCPDSSDEYCGCAAHRRFS